MLTVSINILKLLTQYVNRLSTHYVNRYQDVNSCVNNSVNTSETMLAKCAALSTLPLKLSRLLGHGTDATHDVLAVSRAVYDDAVLWCVCACVCVGMCVCVWRTWFLHKAFIVRAFLCTNASPSLSKTCSSYVCQRRHRL
jgi:hypothetical protein